MSMVTAQRDSLSLAPVDESRMVALLRDVLAHASPPSVAEVLRVLETTPSFRLRNAAALALADLGATSAGERIGALLGRPDVAPQSGTLLFALDELGARLPSESLLNLLRHGSYEGRGEALGLLDAGRVAWADPSERRRALDDLAALAAGDDAEAAEAARAALAILAESAGVPERTP